MKRLWKYKNGEGYIDVAITILIVAFVMAFSLNMVSLIALNQNLKTVADQLVEYATLNGTTDISSYALELSERTGIDFEYDMTGSAVIDASGKVQLGDQIMCHVTCAVTFTGFDETVFPMTLEASASGLSQVYWK